MSSFLSAPFSFVTLRWRHSASVAGPSRRAFIIRIPMTGGGGVILLKSCYEIGEERGGQL